MRVTQNLFAQSLVGRLNVLTARQYALQSQVSTGLKVQAPEDDPTAMQNVLSYKTSKAAEEQYSSNISTLQSRASSVYSVLQALQTINNRIGEIATIAGDPTKTTSDLANYGTEVSQLIEQAANLANTKDPVSGEYLFGGTRSSQSPFTITRDTNGNITGVTYQGNTSASQVEIASGATLAVDVPGENTSGSGSRGLLTDSRSGADLFNHLIAFKNNLLAGNKTAITSSDVPALQNDENNLLYHIGNNGAIQTRLNAAATFATTSSNSLDSMISNASNADIVQTMVQLNEAQNSYQAALASGSKIMQMSLLNYIR
jgi:flagellar hook-associated protein 3 FlgL